MQSMVWAREGGAWRGASGSGRQLCVTGPGPSATSAAGKNKSTFSASARPGSYFFRM